MDNVPENLNINSYSDVFKHGLDVSRALGLKDGTDVIWNEVTKEVIKRTIEVK